MDVVFLLVLHNFFVFFIIFFSGKKAKKKSLQTAVLFRNNPHILHIISAV